MASGTAKTNEGRPGAGRLLTGLVLFGAAFGFVEAAVVIDLRAIYEPMQRRLHPATPPGELFPLLRLDELAAQSREARMLLGVEVAREASTIVMLAAVAVCAGGSFVRAFAAFLVAFGVWDVTFYLVLKTLIDWPASVWTWDLLFLIPAPWVGPVLAPVVVAITMAACGAHAILRETSDHPVRPSPMSWLVVFGGGLLIVSAFCHDARHYLDGGVPGRFPWLRFAVGELLALSGYVLTAFAGRRHDRRPAGGQ